MTKFLTRLTQSLLVALFGATLLALVTLPWMLDSYLKWTFDIYISSTSYRNFVLVFLSLTALGALWILAELMLMMRTLDGNPFVLRNVSALRRMGCTATVMAAAFFVKCIAFFTPMTFVAGGLLLLCGLFSLVLAGVFAQAVLHKEENDLTI